MPELSLRAYPEHRSRYVLLDEATHGTVGNPTTDRERQAATFWNMPPRVPGAGRSSLQLVTRPGFYLIVPETGQVRLARERMNADFNNAATFVTRPGLAGGRPLDRATYQPRILRARGESHDRSGTALPAANGVRAMGVRARSARQPAAAGHPTNHPRPLEGIGDVLHRDAAVELSLV